MKKIEDYYFMKECNITIPLVIYEDILFPMLEEINDELKKLENSESFIIYEIKNKNKQLRVLHNKHYLYNSIDNIINKYYVKAKNICFSCGKNHIHYIDKYYNNVYLGPICKDCFISSSIGNSKDYDNMIDK